MVRRAKEQQRGGCSHYIVSGNGKLQIANCKLQHACAVASAAVAPAVSKLLAWQAPRRRYSGELLLLDTEEMQQEGSA
jgi:hypothetical protein